VTEPKPESSSAAIDVSAPPKRPALLFVLGAFGLVIGALVSATSLNTALGLLLPRDKYIDIVKQQNPMGFLLQPAQLEQFALHEAEAQYDRRLATLPLAVAGIVISCLLFSGALRSMMGDSTALATWSLAAMVGLPHRLLTFIAAVVTTHDVERLFGGLAKAPFLETPLALDQTIAGMAAVLLTIYFAACLLMLRRLSVRASDDGKRSRP
jgi:hypothetical protein